MSGFKLWRHFGDIYVQFQGVTGPTQIWMFDEFVAWEVLPNWEEESLWNIVSNHSLNDPTILHLFTIYTLPFPSQHD